MQLNQRIKERAVELGFDLVGIAPAGPSPDTSACRQWLESGNQAGMQWLEREPERRCDVRKLLPAARSVVVVGISYFTRNPTDEIWNDPLRGRIARFAWGHDYHDVITPRLRELAKFIDGETHTGGTRAYMDTGPVLERSIARLAGIGAPGYSTNLIAPGFGSYIFLGEIITSAEIEPDEPAVLIKDDCASCCECLSACPTSAIRKPYILDSRRCISYLTIESKGSIPVELRPLIGNWIFGCDDCQECCQHMNRLIPPQSHQFLEYSPQTSAPLLVELMGMDESEFRKRFKGTPIIRAKRRGLLRNVAIALGNSHDPSVLPALKVAANDEDRLIREHAEWALENI